MAGPSLGWGAALQERFKYSDTPNRVIENAMARKQAIDREDEKQLVSDLDFKVDYDKVLPVYGKAIAQEQAGLYNKYAKYRQEDRGTARQRLQLDLLESKRKIGEWMRSNDALKKDIALGPEYLRNSDFHKLATSTTTTFDDLSKASHPLGYYAVGQQGEYSSMPVKQYTPDVKLNEWSTEIMPGTKPSPVQGKAISTKRQYISDMAILNEAQRIAQDPGFVQQVFFDRPDLYSDDPKIRGKNVLDAALMVVKAQARKEKYEQIYVDLPNPKSSGSGDNRTKPEILRNQKETINFPEQGLVLKSRKDEDGTTMYWYQSKDGKIKYDEATTKYKARAKTNKPTENTVALSVSTPDAQTGSLRASPEMYDSKTNTSFGEMGIVENFDFKPTGVRVVKRVGGDYELYAIGPVIKNVNGQEENSFITLTDDKGKELERVYNVSVPYEQAKGLLAKKYDLTDLENEFEKFKEKNRQSAAATTIKEAQNQSPKTPPANYTGKTKPNKKGEVMYYVEGQGWVGPFKQ